MISGSFAENEVISGSFAERDVISCVFAGNDLIETYIVTHLQQKTLICKKDEK